jgi:hypothetical protein
LRRIEKEILLPKGNEIEVIEEEEYDGDHDENIE